MATAHDNEPDNESGKEGLSRRSVLQLLGVTFAACTLAELDGCSGELEVGPDFDPDLEVDDSDLTVATRIEVVRARDLLVLTIGLSNLRKTANTLTRTRAGDAFITLDFPPQALLEEAVPFPTQNRLDRPAEARMSGPSRLAFLVPAGFTSVPYTLEAILSLCAQCELKLPGVPAAMMRRLAAEPPVSPETFDLHPFAAAAIDRATAAIDPGASQRIAQRAHMLGAARGPIGMSVQALASPTHPYRDEVTTFVEMPFRLLLAPTGGAAFSHTSALPSDPRAPVELWHTRLCARDPATGLPDARRAAPSYAGILRARDQELNSSPTGIPNESLKVSERLQLASLAPYAQDSAKIELRRMMLSALGGSLDAHAEFTGSTLQKWIHRMHLGREYFVQVTKLGCLLPFGHKAIKVKITERNEDPRRGQVGLLFQYTLVLVANPLVRFGGYPVVASGCDYLRCHDFPFGLVELTRTMWEFPGDPGDNFEISATGQRYPVVAYDQGGNQVRFDVPLYFFTSLNGAEARNYSTLYGNQLAAPYDLAGQRVKYAPSSLDDTTFETARFLMRLDKAPPSGVFSTTPRLSSADMTIESVRRVTEGQPVRTYVFHKKFIDNGISKPENNRAQLLFALPGGGIETLEVKSTADSSTGFVRPNMSFNAISRTKGPIFEPPAATTAFVFKSGGDEFLAFDPKKYFSPEGNGASAAARALAETLLFGTIKLVDVLEMVTPGHLADDLVKDPLRYAPKFMSEAFSEIEKFLGVFTALGDKMGALHKQVLKELDVVKSAPDTLKREVETLLNDIKARGKELFDAIELMLGDIKNLPSSLTALLDHADAVFPKVTAVLTPVIQLADRVPSPELQAAVGKPVGIIQGMRREFEAAAQLVKAWDGKRAEIERIVKAAQTGLDMIRDQTLRLEWRPHIKDVHITSPVPLSFVQDCDEGLALNMEIRAKAKDDKPAGIDFSARIDRFSLLFGANKEADAPLTLKFKHLEVKQLATRKPDVDVVLADMRFGGPLSFIQTIADLVPRDGFSDPPFLTIDGDGIHAGFTQGIPDVAVGMFSMQNLNVGAEVVIPLIGKSPLKFSFHFCTRESPFLVTVSMLGGGGYFKFEMDTAGGILVEGSLCVAAAISINLGVAAGSVSISAGIFFSFGSAGTKIGGFLCLHGSLNVLGIITISLDLRLELWYDGATGKIIGRATLRVEIEILFFSKSVEIEFERRFAGSNGDPTLRETMGEDLALPESTRFEEWAWKEYVCAFA